MSLRYAYRMTPWFLGFAVALTAHAMHLESDQARARRGQRSWSVAPG